MNSGVDPSVNESNVDLLLDYMISIYPKDTRIIDIGCGIGHLVKRGEQRGIDIEGIDYGDECLQRKVCSKDIYKLNLLNEDFQPPSKYDSFVSMECIEHIPESGQKLLFSNFKKLAPKGIISIHNCPPENDHHKCIRSRQWWEDFFRDNNIDFTYLEDFPIKYWTCSFFYKINFK